MFNEFKSFFARGNVVDLAVGIVIGAAFTAIITSMVGDVLMPVIGVFTSGIDFSTLFIALDGNEYANIAEAEAAGAAIVKHGLFINAVVNFLIVAFVIFMLVKQVNKLKEKEATAPAKPAADVVLLGEIRDLLKK